MTGRRRGRGACGATGPWSRWHDLAADPPTELAVVEEVALHFADRFAPADRDYAVQVDEPALARPRARRRCRPCGPRGWSGRATR